MKSLFSKLARRRTLSSELGGVMVLAPFLTVAFILTAGLAIDSGGMFVEDANVDGRVCFGFGSSASEIEDDAEGVFFGSGLTCLDGCGCVVFSECCFNISTIS